MRLSNPNLSIFLIAAIVIVTSFSGRSLADDAPSANRTPRFVVNLLDYVGADYAGAVDANGKVTSESEYKEQNEFVENALATAKTLSETKNPTILAKIEELKGLVAKKAKPAEVAKLSLEAKELVIAAARIEVAPTRWPSLKRGQELYAANCVSCHGAAGKGDGPAGVALDPRPANFAAEDTKKVPPFKAFNVIRVGVPGTGMVAWRQFSDQDTWALAFFVSSFRYAGSAKATVDAEAARPLLSDTARLSDSDLLEKLPGSAEAKRSMLVALRTHSEEGSDASALAFAKGTIAEAGKNFRDGNFDAAKTLALKAYLEGIEPIEPKLRANDPEFLVVLEGKMAGVRAAIEGKASPEAVDAAITQASTAIDAADRLIAEKAASPWVTFLITAGIILREGFEAVLILIALLAVIRASGSKKAAAWVHAGWIGALGIGALAWIFSGWLIGISGAQREMMEGVTSALAVAVLLYMGFWLHSKTEIHRWTHFIDVKVKTALAGGNLWGLFAISFMAVFREAFETVLFMRAVWLEGGEATKTAMAAGLGGSLAFLLVSSWMLVNVSAKLPLRKVFSLSSILMIALSVILAGKGAHSLQETGFFGVTPFLGHLRFETIGLYPTLQTVLSQTIVLAASVALWVIGKRPPAKATHAPVEDTLAANTESSS